MNIVRKKKKQGIAVIASLIFLALFSALCVSMMSMSSNNLQTASNHHKVNNVMNAAISGLEVGKYLISTCNTGLSGYSMDISGTEDAVWAAFYNNISVQYPVVEAIDPAMESDFTLQKINLSADGTGFQLRFYRDTDPTVIKMVSEGSDNSTGITRKIAMDTQIQRDTRVLEYAVASRGRIWLTNNTVVDGDLYSSWDATNYGLAGIETTSEVVNNGTLSVINTQQELEGVGVQMETLDENGNPMFDEDGNRIYSPEDTVQGFHEGIEYGVSDTDMPGMDASDYDTSSYENTCLDETPSSYSDMISNGYAEGVIPASSVTEHEYFPHVAGDYGTASASSSSSLYRHVYDGITFTNAKLVKGRNALFKNCTFEGVLFVESTSYTTQIYKTNNVRFENCEFNGVIVTDVPLNSTIKWVQNCLYFTGGAQFNNQWSQQEATILAPNFNVNLGNTGELEEQSSVLKGVVVGGIVDIRGIVEVEGTIVSMYDTSAHSSGYVTNIGSTDDDGGSEGGAIEGEDIDITPAAVQLLPDGIQSDIIIVPQQSTYSEIL